MGTAAIRNKEQSPEVALSGNGSQARVWERQPWGRTPWRKPWMSTLCTSKHFDTNCRVFKAWMSKLAPRSTSVGLCKYEQDHPLQIMVNANLVSTTEQAEWNSNIIRRFTCEFKALIPESVWVSKYFFVFLKLLRIAFCISLTVLTFFLSQNSIPKPSPLLWHHWSIPPKYSVTGEIQENWVLLHKALLCTFLKNLICKHRFSKRF